jgi:hypothetical protein
MGSSPGGEFSKREAQWEAFRKWKSELAPQDLSVEERLAWYEAAFNFSREISKPATISDIEDKVQHIQDVRRRLAYLK